MKNNSHAELVKTIKEKLSSNSNSDKRLLRRIIHNNIQRIISHITIHNARKTIYPWEQDFCSRKLIDVLKDKGINTNKKIYDFLDTERGKKLYNESERYYKVHFKNGTIKKVHPFDQFSYYSIYPQIVKYRKKIKNKHLKRSKLS